MTSRKSSRAASKAQVSAVLAAAVAGLGFLGSGAHAVTWKGNAADGNLGTGANWVGNVAPSLLDPTMLFSAVTTSPTTLVNTFAQPMAFNITNITFDATAPSFTFTNSGNSVLNVGGNVTNQGTNLQTFNNSIQVTSNTFFDPGTGSGFSFGGNLSGGGGFQQTGNGFITMSGLDNTRNGRLWIDNGTLVLTGGAQLYGTAITPTPDVNANLGHNGIGQIIVGSDSGSRAVMIISNATVMTNSSPTIIGEGANSSGLLVVQAGSAFLDTGGQELWIGAASGASGAFINSGFSRIGSWLAPGRQVNGSGNAGIGLIIQNAGTLTVLRSDLTDGSFPGSDTDIHAELDVHGGYVYIVNNIRLSENWSANMVVDGTGIVDVRGQVNLAVAGGAAGGQGGTLMLSGGTLTTTRLARGTQNATHFALANFNGGVLKARSGTGSFMTGLGAAYVYGGGVIIDDSGTNNTINQALLAPNQVNGVDNGVNLGTFAVTGSGFLSAPLVEITGGGGAGATGEGIIDANGNLTGLQLWNPGAGYTFAPSVTFLGGGGTVDSMTGALGLGSVANSGGLTKRGGGVLTMAVLNLAYLGTGIQGSSHGYTGATNITGGLTLNFSDTRAATTNMIVAASPLTLNGASLTIQSNNGTNNLASISQTFAGTTLNAGSSPITVLNNTNASNSVVLNLGALTHSGNGISVPFTIPTGAQSGANGITTTSGNTDYTAKGGSAAILGGWATIGQVGGIGQTDWATVSGGQIVPLAIYNPAFAAAADVSSGNALVASAMTINSLRFDGNGAYTVTLTNPLTIASGGLLVAPGTSSSNTVTITGSTLTSNNDPDLIIHQNSTIAVLTIASQITGNVALTKAGGGTLALGNVANNFSGKVYINAGVLNIAADGSLGTATGADAVRIDGATLQLGGNANFAAGRGITLSSRGGTIDTNGFNATYGGTLTPVDPLSPGGFTKTGAGLLLLTANQPDRRNYNVATGTLKLGSGVSISTDTINAQTITVGTVAGNAILDIGNGSAISRNYGSDFNVETNASANAEVILGPGGVLDSARELHIGNGAGGYAAMHMTGGTVRTGTTLQDGLIDTGSPGTAGFLVVGFGGDAAVWNQSGGEARILNVTIGAGGATSNAVVNLSGGQIRTVNNGQLFVGEVGKGVMNASGGTVTVYNNFRIGVNAGSFGVLNLLAGGTVEIAQINRNSTNITMTEVLNFNGGTLRRAGLAGNTQGTFIGDGNTGLGGRGITSGAYVWAGGAFFDTNGTAANVTVLQPLLAPTGCGVATIPLSQVGTGYIEQPIVQITSGTNGSTDGVAATAIANINGSGCLTSITITNPGVNYTGAPVVTLLGGGGGGAVIDSANITLASNASLGGAVTKLGQGTLTLASTGSTYSGGTNVNAGVLFVGNDTRAGFLPATGNISVLSGATFNMNATGGGAGVNASISGAFNVGNGNGTNAASLTANLITVNSGGSVGGGGTINAPITVSAGGAVDLRNNAAGTLTVGNNITVGDGSNPGNLKFDIGQTATVGDALNLGANNLDVNAGGAKVFVTDLGSAAPGTSYTIATFGAVGGTGSITLDASSVHLNLNTVTLTQNTGNLVVSISGASVKTDNWWRGDGGSGNVSGAAFWNAVDFISTATGNSNFNTTQSGGVNTNQFPGVTSNVEFGINGATNLATTLGQSFNVLSVQVKGTTGAVSVDGTNTAQSTANTLTINAGGVINDAGAGGLTTTAPLILGVTQTWSNNSTTALISANAQVSGNAALSINGAAGGTVVLGAANTYTGGTYIGVGVLQVGNGAALGTGPVSFAATGPGILQLNGQTLQINGLNSADSSPIIQNTSATTNATLVVNTTTSTNTFAGTIQDGGTATLGLRVQGGGSLVLTGGNTYTGVTTVRFGALILPSGGAITTGTTQLILVGDTAATQSNFAGILNVAGGSVTSNKASRPSIEVGTATGSAGDIRISGGAIVSTPDEFWLGVQDVGSYAGMTMTGGNVIAGRFLVVGFNNSTAAFNMSGGSFTQNNTPTTIAAIGNTSGKAVMNLTGNAAYAADSGGIYVGESGFGVLNVSGNATMHLNNDVGGLAGMRVGVNGGARGIFNLMGGSVNLTRFSHPSGSALGVLNFNGGTLMALESESGGNLFLPNTMTHAYVWPGGFIMDSNGSVITIAQGLEAPSGSGVSAVTFSGSATGFIDTPVVLLGAGGNNDATAVANIDANGNLTSITVTNPGTGYTAAPSVTLLGNNTSFAATFTGTVAANSSGAVTYKGSGNITLSGNNTYTGQTTLAGGVTVNVSANTQLGGQASGSAVNLDGSTLHVTSSFTMDNSGANKRNLTLSTNNGTINVDALRVLTISGNITGGGSLSLTGTGTVNLSGTASLSGDTNVNAGVLYVSGTYGGSGKLNVNSTAGLGGTGNINVNASINSGGALSLLDSKIATLNMATLAVDGGNMTFDLGGTTSTVTDVLAMSGNLDVGAGNANVILNYRGISPGTYVIATFAGGNATAINTALDPGSAHYGGSTATLAVNGGNLTITITGAAIPSAAYWKGTQDNIWKTANGGNFDQTNWVTVGGADTNQVPAANTDVFFSGTPSSNTSTMMGHDFSIKSLTMTGNETNPVTIDGSANTLALEGGGITVQSGSGGLTLTANVNVEFDSGLAETFTNQSAAPLVVGGPIISNGNLTLAGNSVIQLNGNSTYTGSNTITGGTVTLGSATALGNGNNSLSLASGSGARLQINGNNVSVGSLSAPGATETLENNASGNAVLVVNNSGNNTVGAMMQDGSGGGTFGLSLYGNGTLNITNNNTMTGPLQIQTGKVVLTGNLSTGTAAQTYLGVGTNNSGNTGTALLVVDGGNYTSNSTGFNGPAGIRIGTGVGVVGAIIINSGSISATDAANGELYVGTTDGGYGALIVNGGNVTTGSWLAVAREGGSSVFNVHGGNVSVLSNQLTIGSYLGAANVLHVNSTMDAGNVTVGNNMFVSEYNNSVVTIAGTANVITGNNNNGTGVQMGVQPGVSGVLNLQGGSLTVTQVTTGSGGANHTGTVNFNGGVLKARANTATFLTTGATNGFLNTYVWPGNAIIDDGGFNLTIGQPLLAPTGSGIALGTIAFTNVGGYVAPPLVTVSPPVGTVTPGGPTGTISQATAIAIIDGTGNLTAIQITNPGMGYTAAPTVTLFGGGGSASITGALSLAANPITGGFTKQGVGNVTLSGVNTYGGTTKILGGALIVTANNNLGSITAGGGLEIDNGAVFQTNATFALDNGTSGVRGITLGIGGGTFNLTAANTLTGNGVVTGPGDLTVMGSGVLVLNGINTYAGNTTVVGPSTTIAVATNAGLGNVTLGQTLTLNGGTLRVTGNTSLDNSGNNARAIVLLGTGDTVNLPNGNNVTIPGVISGGDLTLTGNGVLTVTASNTYTGQTNINGGTLAILANDGLGNPVTGAQINMNGGKLQTANTFALDNGGLNSRNISLGASGGGFILTGGNTLTVSGVISGSGNLSVTGAGGTVLVTGATNIGSASIETVNAGATLEFGGGVTHAIGILAGDGTVVVDTGTTVNDGPSSPGEPHMGVLDIRGNGRFNIRANATLAGRTAAFHTLLIAPGGPTWTGTLNLRNNNLIVGSATNTTTFSNVRSQITQAAGTPAPANPWNVAGGITSSSAAAASTTATKTALGYASGTEYSALTGLTLFDSLTFNTTDTLIKYTLVGDANLDGSVNINDFFALSGHINQAGDWSQGDFNYTGTVNINDFFAMTGNFNKTLAVGNLLPASGGGSGGSAPQVAAAPTPEPSSLMVLGLASIGLLARRRRR